MKLGAAGWILNPPEGADPNIGRIDRAVELGLSVVSVGFRGPEQGEPRYMEQVAAAAAKHGIELRIGCGGRFGSASPEERKADVERAVSYLLHVNRYTGIRFSSVTNGPMAHNRWTPDPPMDERIDIIAENLATIADAVASAGITVGLENHCDYRGYECAAMLAKANRPNCMAQIDTGNAFTVFEDPVDCARAMAKWVVSVHLKDIKVTPLVEGRTIAENAPLGQGQVDNLAICQILREQAPDPANIALLIEFLTMPPEGTLEEYVQTSVAWAREKLSEFLF